MGGSKTGFSLRAITCTIIVFIKMAGAQFYYYPLFLRNICRRYSRGFYRHGYMAGLKLTRPKLQTVVIETIVPKDVFSLDERMLRELRISIRELEILTLMAQGLSNQQIADRLFVSLNTIKTHAANLFLKMEVERRTQAVEKGRRLCLIP